MKLVTIEENLRRVNLPWYEISELVSEWHRTRQEQHGVAEAKKGKAQRGGWSMRDTAEELKMSLGFISEAVMVADAVKRDPALKNISDRDTAVRLVRSAAKRINAELEASAPVEFDVNQVYNGPSAEVLKRFDRAIFDVCMTDPPWLKYIDEKLTRDEETLPVFKELYRVMKPHSFLYMFVGFEDFYSYVRRLPEYGFTVSKTPLLWIKKELRIRAIGEEAASPIDKDRAYLHGMVLSKGARSWEYSRDFELILLAVKGSPALVKSVQQSSIKIFPPLAPVSLIHPNEKPVELIRDLLEDCSHEGSLIIDPFAGSGAHLEACKRMKRRFIGIERDHESYEKIVRRLKEVKL
jgi:site-specific DNA-methyltransferase (adenine-specific)